MRGALRAVKRSSTRAGYWQNFIKRIKPSMAPGPKLRRILNDSFKRVLEKDEGAASGAGQVDRHHRQGQQFYPVGLEIEVLLDLGRQRETGSWRLLHCDSP